MTNRLHGTDRVGPTGAAGKQARFCLALCLWMLMIFTFSAPEDWKAGNFGTASILPPSQITLLKLASRLSAGAILTLLIVTAFRRRHSGSVLVKFSPIFLFLAWSAASVFWSPLKTTSIQQLLSFAIGVLGAFAVALNYDSRRTISWLFFHLTVVSTLLCAGLLLLAIFFPQYGALTKQSSGMFHSTSAGATASLATLLVLASFGAFEFRWAKLWLIPTTVLSSATLIVGANRLSIGLTALYAIVICAVFWKRRILAVLMTTCAAAGIFYLSADPKLNWTDQAVEKIVDYTRQGQSKHQFKSISGRAEMWSKIWDSYQDAPWIGHGYFVTSKSGRLFVWREWGNWTAHNTYLQVLVSTGLVGFVLFMLAVLAPIIHLLRRSKRDKINRSDKTALLLTTLLSWYFAWGVLNSSVIGPTQPETVVFMVLYGLAIGWSNRPRHVHPANARRDVAEAS